MNDLGFKPIEGNLLEELGTVISEGRYPVIPQNGPLRFIDTEKRCASRGCGSSTHMKLKGIPYCMMHCLKNMNEMLIELGVAA
jgi:hypothetical protein